MRLPVSLLLSAALVFGVSQPADAVPVSPRSGPEGTASMHGDSLNSDTTPYRGPGADAQAGRPTPLPGVCPTILAGRDGLLQVLCTEYSDQAPTLRLVDPDSGQVL